MRSRLERAASIAGWSYVGLTVAWWGLRLALADRLWWLALLNTLAFYWFAPLVVLLPVALWQRQRRLLCGLALPLALFCYLFGGLFVPSVPAAPTGATVAIASFNLNWGNQDYAAIARSLRALDPDIIGLQEVQPARFEAIVAALPDYPYVVRQPSHLFHTVAVLSRYPIAAAAPLAGAIARGLEVTVELDGTNLTVWNVHLVPSNMPLYPPREFVAQTRDRFRRRQAEVEQMVAAITARTAPLVVTCDCNMTDTSQTYAQLSTVLTDSFRAVNWGLGYTFQFEWMPFPVFRLDYIWHTDGLRSLAAAIGSPGGSDHRPAFAILELPRNRARAGTDDD